MRRPTERSWPDPQGPHRCWERKGQVLSRRATKEGSGKNLGHLPDVGCEGHPGRSLIGIPEDLLWLASEVWQNVARTCWSS